ncbi:cytochrome c biogenesis protein CcdA [Pedobacter immunditicola]|uniref:cytochrome c biogenesis protein CcdA n=1 Tax=Pedobacter immunditicola TaxID=3133440 RepID=UPI00309DE11C
MSLEQFFQNFGASLSEGTLWSPLIVLVAGIIASGVCPCTLPVGLGMAGIVSSSPEESTSKKGMRIAIAFFLRIVVNLTFLCALPGRLGIIITESFGSYWALAIAVISLAAATLAFYGPRMKVSQLSAIRRLGLSGAFAYGFIFSLGTSADPLLLLLTMAAVQTNPLFGLLLAFLFGIGRGLPFLVVGFFAGSIAKLNQLTWLRKSIQVFSDFALLFVSFYYARFFLL